MFEECKVEDGWLVGRPSYDKIVGTFDYETLVSVEDNDYQGDSRYLLKDGTRYGWLQFGWGSCSGCDSLAACDTLEEVLELRDDLKRQIVWFPDKTEALQFFHTHDWVGDYGWYKEEQQQFVKEVIEYLEWA